jgi:hypothetical protein
MKDLNFTFVWTDTTDWPNGIKKDVIEYYKDYPNLFRRSKSGGIMSPGNILVSDLINHLRNNKD